MKILILNWRDIKNPEGGGAEILTHEMAKRWVKQNHQVTQFSSLFEGAKDKETVDGVQIFRKGSSMVRSFHVPVHVAAYQWYRENGKGIFDVVIDEIHGIPFFTPFYVKEKKVALICEVAREVWDANFSFPINVVGKMIEKNYFRFYQNVPFLTISPSTQAELLTMGVKREHITILPMGLTIPKLLPSFAKEKTPTLLFVSRFTKAKGAEDVLRVVHILRPHIPRIMLWVAGLGDPEYVRKLKKIIVQLGLEQNVHMLGPVTNEKKFALMNRATLLIAPSIKEGWGLTIPEAGRVGTPAVAYDVEGLRDVIVQNETGLLSAATPRAMSREIRRVLQDGQLYKRLQVGAKNLALTYSWEKTAQVALSVLQQQH